MFKIVEDKKSLRSFEINILSRKPDPGSIKVGRRPSVFPCLIYGAVTYERHTRLRRPDEERLRIDFVPTLLLSAINKRAAKEFVYHKTLTKRRKLLYKIVENREDLDSRIAHAGISDAHVREGSPVFDPRAREAFLAQSEEIIQKIEANGYPVMVRQISLALKGDNGEVILYPAFIYATLKQARALVYYKKNKRKGLSPQLKESLENILGRNSSTPLTSYHPTVSSGMERQRLVKPKRRRRPLKGRKHG